MRTLYIIVLLSAALLVRAQAPHGINYQGVARDASGAAMSTASIAIQIKLFQGNPNGGGSLVYSEVHNSVATDTFGLYNLVIGSTSGSGTGTFSAIPWSAGNIWVEVSIDPSNGPSFAIVAQQQLMSVPYALYAETAGNGQGGTVSGTPNNIPKVNALGNGLKKSLIFESADSASVGIGTASPNPNAVLEIQNTSAAGAAGRGLIIPRMTYNERSLIPNTVLNHGLVVFQTNSTTLYPQGFWYYDATIPAWLLIAPAQAVWTLTGNALTTPGTNYIGTMDDKDFVFKTGNSLFSPTERMRILSTTNGGNVQFGTPGSEYKFPLSKGNAGDILQMDPTGLNNLIWSPAGSSGNIWTKVGGTIFPTSFGDSVGIGTSTPKSRLDILAATGAGFSLRALDTMATAYIENSNPTNYKPVLDVNAYNTSGTAINVSSFNSSVFRGSSNDATALSVQNNSGNSATIDAFNSGTHSVGYLHNLGVAGSGPVLYVEQNDPGAFAGQFIGGKGITTTGFQLTTAAAAGYVLQSDAAGTGSWVPSISVGIWGLNAGTISPLVTGNVGIGVSAAASPLSVAGTTTAAVVQAQNNGTGDGIFSTAGGTGNGVSGVNTGSGAGILGYSNGTGNAGMFQIANPNSFAASIDVSQQGKGNAGAFSISSTTNSSAAINVSTVGSGPAIFGTTSGTGSVASFSLSNSASSSVALNVGTNGKGSAGNFQATNASSTAPAFQIANSSNAPALKVDGSGAPGAIAGLFNGGSVAIGTGTLAPTSGLDVKTSLGVSVKKYPTAGNYSIIPADQFVVHLCATSGTFTYTLPDATLCPGRVLIFGADQTVTGGTMILAACCTQTINGGTSQSFGLTTGLTKPSIGLVSDGSNWQIIFRN